MTLKRRAVDGWADEASNDDWGTCANRAQMVATAGRVGAFALNDASADAVLLISLPAGSHAVVNSDAKNATGVALVELYDADEQPGSGRRCSRTG